MEVDYAAQTVLVSWIYPIRRPRGDQWRFDSCRHHKSPPQDDVKDDGEHDG